MQIVRAQQQALQLPALVKADMLGVDLYPAPNLESRALVHVTKQGQCALGAAMASAWLLEQRRCGAGERPCGSGVR